MIKSTRLGTICIEEQDGLITNLWLAGDKLPPYLEATDTPLLREAFRQLEQYLQGQLQEFDLPLNPAGTPFMLAVWQQLRQVPYGKTASYKDIAAAIGNPRAARAVGQANRRNPIAIFIPCHRIIGAQGNLGGFSCGLDYKKKLLAIESGGKAIWPE
ncbi:MAG: methylated-DNA--[protein]-cysteine S-methyltransferase [Syntrophomonadaceae bacterium]